VVRFEGTSERPGRERGTGSLTKIEFEAREIVSCALQVEASQHNFGNGHWQREKED
jgi:hypothetical protein